MNEYTKFKKIKKVLSFVWNNKYSSFYRDKYKKAGINFEDINSMEDFKKLPFLTKDEIVKSDPYNRIFLPSDEIYNVSVSSGTTNGINNLSIAFKSKPVLAQKKRISNHYKMKATMYLLPPLRASQYIASNDKEKGIYKRIKIASDINDLPLSAKIASRLRIDSLNTSPTALYFFTSHLKKEYDLNKIKTILLGGEYCTQQKALFLKSHYRQADIRYHYGLSEASEILGLYCRFLDSLATNYFHPSSEFYFEFKNEELIITNLNKTIFPLIRYKTGDSAKIEDFKCKCGANQRMKVLGRINYDSVRIHGTFIYSQLIDKALLPFRKYLDSPLWQLHVYEETVNEEIMPRLKLQVIPNHKIEVGSWKWEAGKKDMRSENKKSEISHFNIHTLTSNFSPQITDFKSLLSKGVSENLYLSARKTLADLVKEGIFQPLEVEFVNSFSEKGKHRYIVNNLE